MDNGWFSLKSNLSRINFIGSPISGNHILRLGWDQELQAISSYFFQLYPTNSPGNGRLRIKRPSSESGAAAPRSTGVVVPKCTVIWGLKSGSSLLLEGLKVDIFSVKDSVEYERMGFCKCSMFLVGLLIYIHQMGTRWNKIPISTIRAVFRIHSNTHFGPNLDSFGQ